MVKGKPIPQLNIKMSSPLALTETKDLLKEVEDSFDEVKGSGQALEFICSQFRNSFEDLQLEILPKSAQDTIDEVNCPFLRYEALTFSCYEFFHRFKKANPLGSKGTTVVKDCASCELGKEFMRLKSLQKQIEKTGIKTLERMAKILNDLYMGKPLTGPCILCLHQYPPILSLDGINIECALGGTHLVSIEHECKKRNCNSLEEVIIKFKPKISEDIKKTIDDSQKLLEEISSSRALPSPKTSPKIVEAEKVEE